MEDVEDVEMTCTEILEEAISQLLVFQGQSVIDSVQSRSAITTILQRPWM